MSNRPANRPGHGPHLAPSRRAWLGQPRKARYRADARHHDETRQRELDGCPLLGGIPEDFMFRPRHEIKAAAIAQARLRREFGPAAGRAAPMVIYDEPGGVSRLAPAPGGKTATLS